MTRLLRLTVCLSGFVVAAAAVGCGGSSAGVKPSASPASKMGDDKMGGDKMTPASDKMGDDKMGKDKMGDDKMGKDKMAPTTK